MVQKNVIEKLEAGVTTGRHTTMLDNCHHLLSYVNDVLIGDHADGHVVNVDAHQDDNH